MAAGACTSHSDIHIDRKYLRRSGCSTTGGSLLRGCEARLLLWGCPVRAGQASQIRATAKSKPQLGFNQSSEPVKAMRVKLLQQGVQCV